MTRAGKDCGHCDEWKQRTEFYRGKMDGMSSWCKECSLQEQARRQAERRSRGACIKCNARARVGLATCFRCAAAYKRWCEKHPEERRANHKKWREKHPEVVGTWNETWKQANREQFQSLQRDNYQLRSDKWFRDLLTLHSLTGAVISHAPKADKDELRRKRSWYVTVA